MGGGNGGWVEELWERKGGVVGGRGAEGEVEKVKGGGGREGGWRTCILTKFN